MMLDQQTISIEVHQDSPIAIDCCELAMAIKHMADRRELRVFNGKGADGQPITNYLRVIYTVRQRPDLAPIEFDVPGHIAYIGNPQQIAQGILREVSAEIKRRIDNGEIR